MIPLPALPLPKIQRGIDVYHAKSFCRWFGIALLGQWILPWSGPGWFAGLGGTIWAAIGGAGLIALSFIKSPSLKLGHYFYAAAGVGILGILWAGSAAAGMWPFNSLGMIGIVAVNVASFLWLRNGWSQQVWIWLIVGAAGLGGGLLLPLGGYGLPLIGIFTVLGAPYPFIVARIFVMVLTLGFLAIVVNWVLQVFLKKENADAEQVERHALVMFFYPLVTLLLIGIVDLPFGTGIWGISSAVHNIVMFGSYMWLAIWGVTCMLELKERNELQSLMQTEV